MILKWKYTPDAKYRNRGRYTESSGTYIIERLKKTYYLYAGDQIVSQFISKSVRQCKLIAEDEVKRNSPMYDLLVLVEGAGSGMEAT